MNQGRDLQFEVGVPGSKLLLHELFDFDIIFRDKINRVLLLVHVPGRPDGLRALEDEVSRGTCELDRIVENRLQVAGG